MAVGTQALNNFDASSASTSWLSAMSVENADTAILLIQSGILNANHLTRLQEQRDWRWQPCATGERIGFDEGQAQLICEG